jgi:hypothetical protein
MHISGRWSGSNRYELIMLADGIAPPATWRFARFCVAVTTSEESIHG